jgi:transcriptional regulator with XRE-family HTH domain
MQQLRELFALHFERGFSQRQIARVVGVARSTVERTLARFERSGLTWPPDPSTDDAALEAALYRGPAHPGCAKATPRPNYAAVLAPLLFDPRVASEV